MSLAQREKLRQGHGKHMRKLGEFRVGDPANPALDALDDFRVGA